MEPNHSPTIKPPLVQMGCPSIPKTLFHGPSQCWSGASGCSSTIGPWGRTIPFPALGSHLLEMLSWLDQDSHTCTRGWTRGSQWCGSFEAFLWKAALECCIGGFFLADLADAPSPLHSQLEAAGIEGWVYGHQPSPFGTSIPKGLRSFLICPASALAPSLLMVLVLPFELDSHLAWCCPIPAGIHTWHWQGAGSGDAYKATGGSLGLEWDLS